ncbi:hypothetical protein ACV22V_15555 [Burkholderia sp. AW33-5]
MRAADQSARGIACARMESHPIPARERRNETIAARDALARIRDANVLTSLAMPLDESHGDFHRARNVSFLGWKKRFFVDFRGRRLPTHNRHSPRDALTTPTWGGFNRSMQRNERCVSGGSIAMKVTLDMYRLFSRARPMQSEYQLQWHRLRICRRGE